MTKQWNAGLYHATASMQAGLAAELLAQHHRPTGSEAVLDVGCGDGRITAQIAASVPQGSVLGTDPSGDMVAFARRTYPPTAHPNLAFQQIGAEELPWADRFDLAVSFSALQWVPRQLVALRNIIRALKRNGKALFLVFPRIECIWGPSELVAHSPRWREYFIGYTQPMQFHDVDGYRILVEEAGFAVDVVRAVPHVLRYPTKTEYETFLSNFLPYLDRIPPDLVESFLHDIGAQFERFTARDEDGALLAPCRTIEVLAYKP
ncbi:MAG: class I SAM-dependent methyltransferase [Nitrospirota bacterium]|nr:class I SAM-dependent methyltransferase [Nitrospirota bacterium]